MGQGLHTSRCTKKRVSLFKRLLKKPKRSVYMARLDRGQRLAKIASSVYMPRLKHATSACDALGLQKKYLTYTPGRTHLRHGLRFAVTHRA